MSIEIKPCPFCGGKEHEIKENGRIWLGTRYSEPVSYSLVHFCDYNQFSMPITMKGKTVQDAIDRWNTRI